MAGVATGPTKVDVRSLLGERQVNMDEVNCLRTVIHSLMSQGVLGQEIQEMAREACTEWYTEFIAKRHR